MQVSVASRAAGGGKKINIFFLKFPKWRRNLKYCLEQNILLHRKDLLQPRFGSCMFTNAFSQIICGWFI